MPGGTPFGIISPVGWMTVEIRKCQGLPRRTMGAVGILRTQEEVAVPVRQGRMHVVRCRKETGVVTARAREAEAATEVGSPEQIGRGGKAHTVWSFMRTIV